jgi:tetratricopeptide (TPR) repeat protein
MTEREIFIAALHEPDAGQRAALLDRECGDDRALRDRVEALLREQEELGSFLERPAEGVAVTGAFTPMDGDDRPAVAAEAPGMAIGPYKLLQEIGEGGMGTVYMAQQTEPVKRLVALKVIKPGMDSRQVIARFEAERQALALMDHPNIAKVFDAGTTSSGRPYFVMELVKGVPLTKYCDERRLTPRERLELFVPVCQAIQHAHQKGIIHRDIKPSNVLVALYDAKPVPKVIDFGVAKATGQQLTEHTLVTTFGAVVGTLEYMSPEQAELNQLDIDTRSDIYSLGVLLYELLTGSTPLDRKRLKEAAMLEVLRIIREEEPRRPSTRLSTTEELASVAANRGLEPKRLSGLVRGELDWIVMRALEKDRNRRYETANGFALDVQRYLADEPVLACPPSALYRLRKFARRNKVTLALAAAVFLAFTVMAASIGWAVRDRQEREAEAQRMEAARLTQVAGQIRESWNEARALVAENKAAAARQKLIAAQARLGNDRSALPDLAAEVEDGAAELNRLQRFLDLIDRVHEVETPPVLEPAWSTDVSHGSARGLALIPAPGRRPADAVTFLLQALACYQILERADWYTTLQGRLLRGSQVEAIRRTAYEELLWLAQDSTNRQEEHGSGSKLSGEAAARQALSYLDRAESAHAPTHAFYVLRAACRKALGETAAAQADQRLADKTPPSLALDHYLVGQAAYYARHLDESVQAFEAALLQEPTHYWSLLKLGYCLNDLGRGKADFAAAARVFTGCILKRPDHAHAYACRANSYGKLGQRHKAAADYSKAIELEPRFEQAWYRRANSYAHVGEYEKAIADYCRAIELEPQDADAWNTRGCVYYNLLDQPGKAVADFSMALKLSPRNAIYWHNRGRAHDKLGQHEKALADYSKAIELDPKDAVAWGNRGLVYHTLGQHEKGLADHSKAIELDAKDARAWSNRGRAHSMLGHHEKALADYSKAIELDSKDVRFWHNRGNAYSAMGQHAKALADFSTAIELDPKYVGAWLDRGVTYCDGLAQYEKAIADFSRAIELDQKNAKAWKNRGVAYASLRQYDKAMADYCKAIQIDPKYAKAWRTRGADHHMLGQHEQALADYSKAIELDSKDAVAWGNRGLTYSAMGRYDKAIADFSRAIELDSKDAAAWYNRGVADHTLGQHKKAIADYSRAIELGWKDVSPWYNRGACYGALGQYARAVADYSKAIELDGKRALIWHARGDAYHNLNQYAKAIADYSKAIRLEPKNAPTWRNRANTYSAMGQYTQTVADYSKAIELDPKDPGPWFFRGITYCDRLAQPEKAIADFSRVLELDQKNEQAWKNRGVAYANLRQYDKAVADYSRAVQLNPKYAKAWRSRGLAYAAMGRDDKAIADFSRAIKLDPKHSWPWLNRADAYGRLGQYAKAIADYSGAIAASEQVAAASPDDAQAKWQVVDAIRQRGDFYIRFGLLDLAAAAFARAFACQTPSVPHVWFCHALLRVHIGDVEGYRKVAAELPRHFKQIAADPARNELARALTLAPLPGIDLDWAARQAELEVQREDRPWTQKALGLVRYRAGKYEQALGPLRKALHLDSHWRHAILSHSVLAMALHRLGRAAEARQALGEAAQKVDDWHQSLMGRFLDPMGETWWDVLEGLVLYREAKILLEGSAPPDDPRPIAARARAFAALGDRAKAEEACRRAVQLGANLDVTELLHQVRGKAVRDKK